MTRLGKPRGASAQIADMAGIDPEIAALFTRKPRARKAPACAPVVEALDPQLGDVDLAAELGRAIDRVIELERDNAALLRAEALRSFRARSAARLRRPAPVVRPRRWARGGARVRDLRATLRLTRLMLARQQAARGAGGLKLHLVGGREQLRARLAELPAVGNPYASIPGKGRG